MKIRLAELGDQKALIGLVAEFRQSLAELRGKVRALNLEAASGELSSYQEKGFPIYVAVVEGKKVVGYLVCRVNDDVVWAESLYVSPAHRRLGIGSSLYAEAERLADDLGNDTLYNWVDPDNAAILGFLQKRGTHVLNLIELRNALPGEEITKKIRVGNHEFDR